MTTLVAERLAVVTAGVGLLTPLLLTQPPAPLRLLLALAVLLLGPGCAALCWLRPADVAGGLAVAVAVGVAVMFVVSSSLLYLRVWSWPLCLTVTGALTVLASVTYLLRGRPA